MMRLRNTATSPMKFMTDICELLQPLDRDEPNGRPQWRFTVFAQDEGGNGLVGYADVQVNLKDINDNAPLFPQGNLRILLVLYSTRSKPNA
jgi:hypothetical protein